MVCVAKNSKSREATSKGERTGHVNPGVRERDVGGTGILFEGPNPTGSRPRDLIGLYRKGQGKRDPNRRKGAAGKRGGRQGLHCGEANPNQMVY